MVNIFFHMVPVATLALGSWPKQRVAKLRAKRKTRESHHMFPRVQRVWRNEPSHFQVNSNVRNWSPKWTPESSKHDCRGQNSSPQNILYSIRNILECRCIKLAQIAHLDIWNTNYGPKKGQESNWQFDSQPLKVKNQPDFLVFTQRATHRWKNLKEGYNFALNLITIEDCTRSYAPSKSQESPLSGVPVVGSPMTKSHLDVVPAERCRVYYKGEGGGFPQVWVVASLMCPNCLWLVLAPKVLQLCTNHLVLVLCKSMWVIETCHFFLVPSQNSNSPLYPSTPL
jgi:hypothetical protein